MSKALSIKVQQLPSNRSILSVANKSAYGSSNPGTKNPSFNPTPAIKTPARSQSSAGCYQTPKKNARPSSPATMGSGLNGKKSGERKPSKMGQLIQPCQAKFLGDLSPIKDGQPSIIAQNLYNKEMAIIRPHTALATNVEDNVSPQAHRGINYTVQKEIGPYKAHYIKDNDLSPRMQVDYKQIGMRNSPTKVKKQPEPLTFKRSQGKEERLEMRNQQMAMENYLTTFSLSATNNRDENVFHSEQRKVNSRLSNKAYEKKTQIRVNEKIQSIQKLQEEEGKKLATQIKNMINSYFFNIEKQRKLEIERQRDAEEQREEKQDKLRQEAAASAMGKGAAGADKSDAMSVITTGTTGGGASRKPKVVTVAPQFNAPDMVHGAFQTPVNTLAYVRNIFESKVGKQIKPPNPRGALGRSGTRTGISMTGVSQNQTSGMSPDRSGAAQGGPKTWWDRQKSPHNNHVNADSMEFACRNGSLREKNEIVVKNSVLEALNINTYDKVGQTLKFLTVNQDISDFIDHFYKEQWVVPCKNPRYNAKLCCFEEGCKNSHKGPDQQRREPLQVRPYNSNDYAISSMGPIPRKGVVATKHFLTPLYQPSVENNPNRSCPEAINVDQIKRGKTWMPDLQWVDGVEGETTTGACKKTVELKELIFRKVYNEVMATENRKQAIKWKQKREAAPESDEEDDVSPSPTKGGRGSMHTKNASFNPNSTIQSGTGFKGGPALNKENLDQVQSGKKGKKSGKNVSIANAYALEEVELPTKLLRPQDGTQIDPVNGHIRGDKSNRSNDNRSQRSNRTAKTNHTGKSSTRSVDPYEGKTVAQMDELKKLEAKEMTRCDKEERMKTKGRRLNDLPQATRKEVTELRKESKQHLDMYNLLEKKKQEKIPIAQKLSEECGNSTFFNYYQNSSKNGDVNNKLKSKLDDFKLIAQGFAERYKIPLKASI